jgi:hypothetical protein
VIYLAVRVRCSTDDFSNEQPQLGRSERSMRRGLEKNLAQAHWAAVQGGAGHLEILRQKSLTCYARSRKVSSLIRCNLKGARDGIKAAGNRR